MTTYGVWKRIKSFFTAHYFDKNLPFDYRIYMIFFFECYIISILSATTNTLLEKGIPGIVLQWTYIAFCTVVLFIPLSVRKKLTKPLLLFTTLFYIPFLYFTTAGYDGTALLFSLLGIFLLSIVFHKKQRIIFVALNIAIYVFCVFAQYFFPGIVTPHGAIEAKVVDLLVALVLSAVGLAIMTVYINNAFELERDRITGLLSQLAQSNDALADLTNRDVLTGVYNRRFLTGFLDRELKTVRESNKTLCVLMLDLDHFKRINDTYGHAFGDEVLITVTRSIQQKLRGYDILARYGGEEFLVALPDVSLETAAIIAERIRESASEIVLQNGARVTLSIGLAQSQQNESSDALIDRADSYMYQAKQKGRNRVAGQVPGHHTIRVPAIT